MEIFVIILHRNKADGAGFLAIAFFSIVILLLLTASVGFSWVMAPFALTISLLQSPWWWLIPAFLGIAYAGNWAGQKSLDNPHVTVPAALACIPALLIVIIVLFDHANNGMSGSGIFLTLLGSPLLIALLVAFFYPFTSAYAAAASLPLLKKDKVYVLHALVSYAGLVCAVLALQGLEEFVIDLFKQIPESYEIVRLNVGMNEPLPVPTYLAESYRGALNSIARALSVIPPVIRCIGCGFLFWRCWNYNCI